MIARADVRALLERAARDRGPSAANHLHRFLRAAFRWATREELIPRNPIDGMERPRPERRLSAEERTLTDAEVVKLWNAPNEAADEETPVASPLEHAYVKLMLLCGTRRHETARARWRDFDLDAGTWTLPPENRKGGCRGLVIPLPRLAVRVLRSIGPGDSDRLVFKHVTSHPDRVVKSLREASGVDVAFHDLRATCATGCAEAGAAPHVVALVLGYVGVPGTPSVTSLYDRGDRTPEVRAALEAWAARVEALAKGRAKARVVAFRR